MKTGVVLLNLGGPGNLDEVKPFLLALFRDREIIRFPGGPLLQPLFARMITRKRLKGVKEKYQEIGGGSPLLGHTTDQAQALKAELTNRGFDIEVGIAMRYSSPTSDEALRDLEAAGVERLVALTLYPQYSRATTGSSLNALGRAMTRLHFPVPLLSVDRYPDHPGYVAALADTIDKGLATWPEEDRGKVVVLFSAHSLPQRFVDGGDPYVDEVNTTIRAVRALLPDGQPWRLGFQSRVGPVKWVGPSVDDTLSKLAKEGIGDVLIVGVSFVSDHIETLHELDIEYGEMAEELGIRNFRRAPSLNDSKAFIRALADLTCEALS